jgi:hypothetical protein
MTRPAKAAHGIDYRIEQTEEEETEIVGLQQFAFGTTGPFFAYGGSRLRFGEPLPEVIQQFPAGEVLFVDLSLGAAHE